MQWFTGTEIRLLQSVLQAHAAKSKQDMTAFEKYDEPQLKVIVKANKQALGKTFKRQAQAVQDALEQMQVHCAATSGMSLLLMLASVYIHGFCTAYSAWHVLHSNLRPEVQASLAYALCDMGCLTLFSVCASYDMLHSFLHPDRPSAELAQ